MNDTSKIYWTSVLGMEAVEKSILGSDDSVFTNDIVNPSFDNRMLPLRPSETTIWHQDYIKRLRLHLLIVVSASLESYLKDITFLFLASKGHLAERTDPKKILKLNEIGAAIGSPILSRSSVPEPLKYAQILFDVNFGSRLDTWIKAYKKRCVVAHNGGMATPNALKSNPGLGVPEFGLIGVSWEELKKCMKAADEIATIIDIKAIQEQKGIHAVEAEQLLRIMHRNRQLPHRDILWKVLNDEYGLRVPKKSMNSLERMFYLSRKLSSSGKSEVKK